MTAQKLDGSATAKAIKSELTVEACRRAGVTMYCTGTRHFFH